MLSHRWLGFLVLCVHCIFSRVSRAAMAWRVELGGPGYDDVQWLLCICTAERVVTRSAVTPLHSYLWTEQAPRDLVRVCVWKRKFEMLYACLVCALLFLAKIVVALNQRLPRGPLNRWYIVDDSYFYIPYMSEWLTGTVFYVLSSFRSIWLYVCALLQRHLPRKVEETL
jgi:hypothetical protein